MANSKKKANKPKQEKGTVETKKPVETMPSISKPGVISKAQLTMLILLSIGISRLLQVKSAFVKTETGEPSTTCLEHLSEEACQDDAVHALLQYKYQTESRRRCSFWPACYSVGIPNTSCNVIMHSSWSAP
jgi:hypothetical protein